MTKKINEEEWMEFTKIDNNEGITADKIAGWLVLALTFMFLGLIGLGIVYKFFLT